jgi:hypothetical protein
MAAAALLPRPPAPWRAYAGLLLRRRKGLGDDRPVPLIGCGTGVIQLDADWLAHYRELIGLPSDEPAVLPPLALQIAAAPLHLEILSEIAEMLSDRQLRDRLKSAADAAMLHAVIAGWRPMSPAA